MKDGFSLVVILSSIPSSATRGPDVDLSSEGSNDVLKDPDDELVLKKKISDSDDEESAPPETEFMGMCLFPFPFFFVTSSLHVCICVSPLLQSPFICMSIFVLCRLLRDQGS